MSHIFISYSRRDLDFAQKIVDALAANNLDTWIDWKSIPKGEDWEQEIYRGIEKADAFLFLISPDSVVSRPCNNEITHALRNGKRILPIFISNANHGGIYAITDKFLDEENRKEIGRRNFILCREGIDDFGGAITEIQTTIHTDYEWLKYHTELQVKALEWERHEDDSRLLRGKELREAEEKLAGAGSQKDPQPTELQRNYLLSSQRYEARQRRQFTVGLGIVLIVVFALAVFALDQRNDALNSEATAVAEANAKATALVDEENARATAQAEKERAEEQARLAISRKLVSQSESQLNKNNYTVALLLALEAGQVAETTEAFNSLREAIHYFAPTTVILEGHKDEISVANWNAAENFLLTAGHDGTVRVWDAYKGKEELVINGHIGPVNQAIWNTEESRILTVGEDGTGKVWDSQTGKQRVELKVNAGPIRDATWNEDESRIITINDETIHVWDSITGDLLSTYSNQLYDPEKNQWSSDKSKLLSIDTEGGLNVWDIKTGKNLLAYNNDDSQVIYAHWSPNERKILVISESGTAQVLDGYTGRVIINLAADPNDEFFPNEITVKHAYWDPYGKKILIVTAFPSPHVNNTVQVWDAVDGHRQFRLDGHFRSASWNHDGSRILTFGGSDSRFWGEPQIWDAQNGEELASLSKYASGVWTEFSIWSKDGSLVLSIGNNNNAWLWDAETGGELAVLSGHTDQINHAYWSTDQRHILTVSADTKARLWDIKSTYELPVISDRTYNFTTVRALRSPDETRILTYAGYQTPAYIWDLITGELRLVLQNSNLGIVYAKWNRDGSRILTAEESGSIQVWDAQSGNVTVSLRGHTSYLTSAVWSADEDRILTANGDSTARIWDVATGVELIRLVGHTKTVLQAVWNFDESRILTTSHDGTARIWDAATGKELLVIGKSNSFGIGYAVWNTDGSRILTPGDYDESPRVWDAYSGRELFILGNDTSSEISATIWDHSETRILTGGSYQGPVRVWNAQTGMEILTLPDITIGSNYVKWSADERYIVTSNKDNTVRVWDAQTGALFVSFSGHSDTILGVNWNRDNSSILTYSRDGTLRVWDVSSGNQVFIIDVSPDSVQNAFWNSDETRIFTIGANGAIHQWFTRMHDLQIAACQHASRNFTYAEWMQFFGNEPYRQTCPNLPFPEE